MKKIVTVIALALMCSGAYAQFNQGRWLAGGNLGFSAQTEKVKTDASTTTVQHITNFSLSPDVGYFVIDNLAVGASLNVSSATYKGDGTDNSKRTISNFTFNPFARYYLPQNIFFQAQVGFGSGSEKDKANGGNTTVTTKHGVFLWGVSVGYAYFLNDYVAIEPSIGYSANTDNYKDQHAKDINSGIGINVGLQVYLGPRK